MSAEGLGPQLEHVRDAWAVRIEARRRFAKPSQRGGCLAMDVAITTATVTGEALFAVDSVRDEGGGDEASCEGLMIAVAEEGQGGLVRREGYSPRCFERIRKAAGNAGVARFLEDLAASVGDAILPYREALHAVAGESTFKASHYLPHPVRTPTGPAVIFVAPAVGATGIPGLDSAKAAYPNLTPRSAADLFTLDGASYPGFDPVRQTWYAGLCLRAAAHGIWIGDLLPKGAPTDHPIRGIVSAWMIDPSPLHEERARVAEILDQSDADLATRFGRSLEAALRRSGLGSSAP